MELLLSKIYTIKGRLNRWRYFKYSLLWVLTLVVIEPIIIGIVVACFSFLLTEETIETLCYLIMVPVSLVTWIVGIMLSIRRLHDLNKSGWFMLISFIPLIDVIFALYLYLAKGTVGSNEYGADPLEN